VLLTFDIIVDKNAAEGSVIELKHQRFSMPNAVEKELPDVTAVCNVQYAYIPVESISIICDDPLFMRVGEVLQLETQIIPAYAAEELIIWSSADSDIVEVDADGLLNAVGAGETIITALCDNKTAECKVIVTASTGIVNPDTPLVSVKVEDMILTVYGLAEGEKACLFSVDGILLKELEGNGLPVSFELTPSLCHILRAADKTFKIITH
ncbi:MAG: Ig-like domain-containing protein, partial [Muribaculaceae bacterium]|nr:Ig-like domain-containing protein [Muribaculaceae bacterium]